MKRLLILAAVFATAAAPAGAEDLSPTAGELAWARQRAVAYWHAEPPCGRESVTVEPAPEVLAGAAFYLQCRINLNGQDDWVHYPEQLCLTYVHEFGHLVLGPTYFANINPSDPAHSPDRDNIMQGAPIVDLAQQQRLVEATGCTPTPPTPRHRHHHRGTKGSGSSTSGFRRR